MPVDITKFEVMEDHMHQKVKIMAVVEVDILELAQSERDNREGMKRLMDEYLTKERRLG